MDGQRFDRLAKLWATGQSRRALLRAALAGGAAALAGQDPAGAAACRAPGSTCREDANCCSRLCGPKDRTGRRLCRCGTETDCPAPNTPCQRVACASGVCTTANVDGIACDADSSLCTQNDTCKGGKCIAGTPIACTAIDECHVAGTCDPKTGICSDPPKTDGSPCGNGQVCCDGTCCPQTSDVCAPVGCCTPEPTTTTCSGRCGPVVSNCGQTVTCPGIVCGSTCCDNDLDCAGTVPFLACCAAGREACHTGFGVVVCCGEGEVCATNPNNQLTGICCPSGRAACGSICCGEGEACAGTFPPLCCPAGRAACGSTCCGEGEECAGTFPVQTCCPSGQEVCTIGAGLVCCGEGEVCMDKFSFSICCPAGREACFVGTNLVCCGQGQTCNPDNITFICS